MFVSPEYKACFAGESSGIRLPTDFIPYPAPGLQGAGRHGQLFGYTAKMQFWHSGIKDDPVKPVLKVPPGQTSISTMAEQLFSDDYMSQFFQHVLR